MTEMINVLIDDLLALAARDRKLYVYNDRTGLPAIDPICLSVGVDLWLDSTPGMGENGLHRFGRYDHNYRIRSRLRIKPTVEDFLIVF